jgi:CheY-like chemotaxis protein
MSPQTSRQPPPEQHMRCAPQFASILIVDDQRFDRSRLKKMCSQLSFFTHIAEADSLAALRDRLRKDRFDLILLDYHLTDGTGLEGVEMIRADGVNHAAATVMVTGTEQHDIALRALKLGMSDYLTKDELSPETLCRAAITALQKSQLARAADAVRRQDGRPGDTVQGFSRDCAHAVKPIVSRMMRQMRELRSLDGASPQDTGQRMDQMEGSLRRLWAFMDDLDQLGSSGAPPRPAPLLPLARRASQIDVAAGINICAPSEQPARPPAKLLKSPSLFRRRPG